MNIGVSSHFFIFPNIRKVTQGINRFRHLLRVVETKATFGLRKVHTEIIEGLKPILNFYKGYLDISISKSH